MKINKDQNTNLEDRNLFTDINIEQSDIDKIHNKIKEYYTGNFFFS